MVCSYPALCLSEEAQIDAGYLALAPGFVVCETGPAYAPRNPAELMRHVFSIDVLECARCGGRMRILAAIHLPAGHDGSCMLRVSRHELGLRLLTDLTRLS